MIMEKTGGEKKSSFLGVAGVNKPFPSLSLKLGSGDCLLLYTDCLLEAANSGGGSFGETGIMEALRKAPGGSAQEILNSIIVAFTAFHGGTALKDDLTAIVIKRR